MACDLQLEFTGISQAVALICELKFGLGPTVAHR